MEYIAGCSLLMAVIAMVKKDWEWFGFFILLGMIQASMINP